MRALEDYWVHILLSFVFNLCRRLLCCFILLLFLTWTFMNIFDLQHSLCSMLFFSHKRNTLPLGNRFPHTYTHTKNSVTQNHLGILAAHTTYSPHRRRHLLDYSFISFFLAFFLSLFSLHDFLITRKRKFALSTLFSSRGLQLPPSTDTWAHMPSISFQ